MISAGDWITIEGEKLIERISKSTRTSRSHSPAAERLAPWAPNLRILRNRSGEIVGRAAIVHDIDGEDRRMILSSGVITVGGFHAEYLPPHITGIIFGSPKNAARNRAQAVVEEEEFSRWASEQATLLANACKDLHSQREVARWVRLFGGNTGSLLLALTKRGWLSAAQIAAGSWPAELLLLEGEPEKFADVVLREDVLVVDGATSITFPIDMHELSRQPLLSDEEEEALGWWQFNHWRLSGAVVEAIASSWLARVEKIMEISHMPTEGFGRRLEERLIGTREGRPVKAGVRIVRRPLP